MSLYEEPEINAIVAKLKEVDEDLANLEKPQENRTVAKYDGIKQKLDAFPTKYDEMYLFQGDLLLQANNYTVSNQLAESVFGAVEMLNRVTPTFENENLKSFRNAFYARYEDEEVPLAVALDSESGVGYLQNTYSGITPLVDDIAFPVKRDNFSVTHTFPFNAMMQRKLSEALMAGNDEIRITDDDLVGFESHWDDVQETISAFVQLVDRNRFVIKSIGGSSAANLIGRFCHLDETLLEHTRQIIKKDETGSEAIYAEIVHLPESRTGNILHRPTLRNHEIPYLAQSSLPLESQVNIEDLMVSVRGDRVLLRSRKHNKIVVPRLTTAHNFRMNALPIYHFLCDMQNQGKRGGFGFSWGNMENVQPYLPRVAYGNAILSVATWNFFLKELNELNKVKNIESRVDCFLEMANRRGVADEVVLEDGDKELYLNLKNRFCVKVLLQLVKKRPMFTLKEFVFAQNDSPAERDGKRFANELLIAYYRNSN